MIGRQMDYLGMWAMEESRFDGLRNLILSADLSSHIAASTPYELRQSAYDLIDGGIAVVQIVGSLMKGKSSFGESTSTVEAKSAIRDATRNPLVEAIMLLVDSPGGTVAGTSDLADEVSAAGKLKPTAAYIEDLGASAAYWVASQAGFISTGATGLVGSIGTYMQVRDSSEAAKMAGVRVHVIKAGDLKGIGTPGTPLTINQRDELQRMIDAVNDVFTRSVAKGRRLNQTRLAEVATGGIFVGHSAKSAGLVDAVESLDQATERLRRRIDEKKQPAGPPKNLQSTGYRSWYAPRGHAHYRGMFN
jgi:signal peptide peptidase SppA